MKVIAALEATGREVYTGAIGFASPHAGLELNVAIRTFEAHSGHLWLGVGGGIVADSDPEAELEECLVKARPLIAAINGRIRPDPSLGVFDTLLVAERRGGQPRSPPGPARAQRRRALRRDAAGDRVPPTATGRCGSRTSPVIRAAVQWRPPKPPRAADRAHAACRPRRARRAQVQRPAAARELSKDGTTPLLLDADGTVLEAAWAAVLIRRDGRSTRRARTAGSCRAPRGRTPSQADLRLQPGDELLLSSSLAGVVPAVLADASREPRAGTPRTPSRTGALSVGSS